MSLKPADIDNIIQLLTQITEALSKTDFLSPKEQKQLNEYDQYELWQKIESQYSRLGVRSFNKKEDEQRRTAISYDKDVSKALKNKLSKAQQEHIESTIKPLRKRLDPFLTPRWPEILQLRTRKQFSQELVESFINTNIGTSASSLNKQKEEIVNELECIKAKLEYREAEQKTEFAGGGKADLETARTAKKKPWYKKVLVWVFLTIMAAVISILIERWFFPQETQNSPNNSTSVKTEGDLSPAVNTGPNSTVNIYYKQNSQIQEEKSAKIYAYVSPDGKILQSNNFRWKITKAKNREGNIVYVINGRQGDTTAISVLPDNSISEYKVSNGYDGMVITFICAEEKISNFRIEVKY